MDTRSKNMDIDEVCDTLSKLIQTCKDGEEGFETAADAVDRADVRDLCLRLAAQRRDFAGELQSLLAKYGEEPRDSGSFLGTMHRGWINLKSAVSGKNEKAIIDECERGEDAAKETYQEALDKNLPADVNSVVSRQYAEVKEAHDQVRALQLQHSKS